MRMENIVLIIIAIIGLSGVILLVIDMEKEQNEKEDFCNLQGGNFVDTGAKCVFINPETKIAETFKVGKVDGRFYLSK